MTETDPNDIELMTPRVWRATDLKPAAPTIWLARQRIPQGAVSLLVGDEGIGKSLLWVWIVAAVTTGKPLHGFGIPARKPGHVVIIITEDNWSETVRPRLEVADADLDYVSVVCIDDDGGGSPTFPRDIHLIDAVDPAPVLVVVDAWLDTVSAGLSVRDPQQARVALHPWKELGTRTDAAVLLITHTNRSPSSNPRDRYGATGELRKKARCTLFAQRDEAGHLLVGPEKSNSSAEIPASMFSIDPIQHFDATDDGDGSVPLLKYVGESQMTARQHIAIDSRDTDEDEPGGGPAKSFIVDYLLEQGGEAPAGDVIKAGRANGFNDTELKNARTRSRAPRIVSRKGGMSSGWVWALDYNGGEQPRRTHEGVEGVSPEKVTPSTPSVTPSTDMVPPSTPEPEPVPASKPLTAEPTDSGIALLQVVPQPAALPTPNPPANRRPGCVCTPNPTPCLYCEMATANN